MEHVRAATMSMKDILAGMFIYKNNLFVFNDCSEAHGQIVAVIVEEIVIEAEVTGSENDPAVVIEEIETGIVVLNQTDTDV